MNDRTQCAVEKSVTHQAQHFVESLPSLGFVVAAETARSMSMLLIGTAVGAIATGLGYRCSLQKVNESAPENKRSEIVSACLIACYAGISLPVIGIVLLAKATGPVIAG